MDEVAAKLATKGTAATELGWPSPSKQWIGFVWQMCSRRTPLTRNIFS